MTPLEGGTSPEISATSVCPSKPIIQADDPRVTQASGSARDRMEVRQVMGSSPDSLLEKLTLL